MRVCSICKAEKAINPHLIFHSSFQFAKKWFKLMKKEYRIKSAVICNQHFKPEDYRELCNRPILKHTAVPQLDINDHKLNTCEESIKHEPINSQDSTAEIDDQNTSVQSIKHESLNFQDSDADTDVCIETIELATDKNIKYSKRKNDSSGDESSVVSKKHCNLKKFGIFRKQDFDNEKLWDRFLVAFEKMRKEKLLLERKNKRLYDKVQKYRHIVEELKEKNLLTGFAADMLSIR